MASSFKINTAGVSELANSAGMTAEAQRVGSAVIARASASSPTKSMDLGILQVSAGEGGVVISVGSTWPFAHLIEWGSINNQPYAPLRNAVSSLGLKFEAA